MLLAGARNTSAGNLGALIATSQLGQRQAEALFHLDGGPSGDFIEPPVLGNSASSKESGYGWQVPRSAASAQTQTRRANGRPEVLATMIAVVLALVPVVLRLALFRGTHPVEVAL
jgi:hypothetical protein